MNILTIGKFLFAYVLVLKVFLLGSEGGLGVGVDHPVFLGGFFSFGKPKHVYLCDVLLWNPV
jgi:hypothetical protein